MRHHLSRPALRLLSFVTGVCVLTGVGLRAQQAAPAAAPLPSGKDIVAKHLAAIGGEAAFKAVNSIHAKGTFELPAQGVKGELEILAARPNRDDQQGRDSRRGSCRERLRRQERAGRSTRSPGRLC